MKRWTAGLAVVIALVAGCGETPSETAADPAPQPPAEQPSGAEGDVRLVDSQSALPGEPADEFADIATSAAGAQAVWQRFQLDGDHPQVDFDTAALLVVGFGESGSCPARFDGLDVEAGRVHVAVGEDGGPDCTADYNPRTLVVEVAQDALPDGGFELTVRGRTFVLSSVPLFEPPPHDDAIVARLTAESPQLDFDAHPRSVPAGERIELSLTNNGEVDVSTGSWPMVLHRWDEQRWLPADSDQGWEEPSSSIDEQIVTVEAGHKRTVAHIVTEVLDRGWYGVQAKLQLGGHGGAVEVHESFEVGAR